MTSKSKAFEPYFDDCDFCKNEYWKLREWQRFCKARCRTLSWRKSHVVLDSSVIDRIEKIEKKMGIK